MSHRWRVLGQGIDTCQRCGIRKRVVKRWTVLEFQQELGGPWVAMFATPPCPGR